MPVLETKVGVPICVKILMDDQFVAVYLVINSAEMGKHAKKSTLAHVTKEDAHTCAKASTGDLCVVVYQDFN